MRLLLKLIKVLNSETDPGQISLGLCFGLIAGLTPLVSPHNILVLFLVMVIRANLSAFIFSTLMFSGVAWVFDPALSRLGLALLEAPALEGLWTALYNITIFRMDNFNNSIVMGSIVVSLVLFVPCFIAFNKLIFAYRERVLARLRKLKLVQALKASRLWQAYDTVKGWDLR